MDFYIAVMFILLAGVIGLCLGHFVGYAKGIDRGIREERAAQGVDLMTGKPLNQKENY